jgi:acetylornithine deacetylase/succinyl-diaminopimelate desuccinylase-like protein
MAEFQLTPDQLKWAERAWSQIDEEALGRLVLQMTDIPSPTGEERRLAQFMVSHMEMAGLSAIYQPIDADQGNAIGRIHGDQGGPELLLYAPIDTAFDGIEETDCPGVGPRLEPHMRPQGKLENGCVIGLGAENPKGYAACLVMAAEAVRRAEVPLKGTVIVGLGAGGMPTNKRASLARFNAGQGTGCEFMLQQGVRGDFAIIAKPGYAVAWEEVGLCWFKVKIIGVLGYVGTRHFLKYKNPIVDAARVISALESWFPEYTKRNTSGLVAPQGSMGAIEAGWPHKPAFIPAACNLYVDLRISPRTDPMDAKHQLEEAIARILRSNPDLDINCEMVLAIPGGSTDPNNWIIQSCIRAWEWVEGKKHQPIAGTSGATDANILRGWGIPTARLGMPPLQHLGAEDLGYMMGVSSVSCMKQLTKCLIYTIIDTCTRTRQEVGLSKQS